jgi:NhaC family Na+:H+ antiporter
MYSRAYEENNLQPKNLSRAIEDGGTVTSALVPWNTCAVFIISTLAVHPLQYGPYAVLNYMVPILAIIFAMTGYKIQYIKEDETETEKERKVS